MCMCCEIAIYVNKFMGSIELIKSLYYIFISQALMTLMEVILTISGVCGEFTEDNLTDIIFYLAIITCVYSTLWAFIVYKKPTADLLLTAEYAILMVPLPCLSLTGYTLLTESVFFYINHVFQTLFIGLNLYYAICIHSVYVEQLYKEQEPEEIE